MDRSCKCVAESGRRFDERVSSLDRANHDVRDIQQEQTKATEEEVRISVSSGPAGEGNGSFETSLNPLLRAKPSETEPFMALEYINSGASPALLSVWPFHAT